jgi:hypothetical protein
MIYIICALSFLHGVRLERVASWTPRSSNSSSSERKRHAFARASRTIFRCTVLFIGGFVILLRTEVPELLL